MADSVPYGSGATLGLLGGQEVLTMPTMLAKLDAQLRGLGGGFVPEPMPGFIWKPDVGSQVDAARAAAPARACTVQ